MTDRDQNDMNGLSNQALDAIFADMRGDAPVPSGDLMARIMADAEAEIAQRAADAAARRAALRPKQRHPLIAAMVAALGGWRAVAGLATAGVAGLAIGLGVPTTVTTLATGSYVATDDSSSYEMTATGYALDDLVPSFYDLAAEG